MVGDRPRSAPRVSTSGSAHPQALRPSIAAASSACTDEPFIASSAPFGSTSGIDQSSSRSNGASAREVTIENRRGGGTRAGLEVPLT